MLEMNFFETFQKVDKPAKMKRQTKENMGVHIRGLSRDPFCPAQPHNRGTN